MDELKRYENPEGKGYVNKEHVYFENLEDFLQEGILGFCGCGRSNANLELIHDRLQLHEKHREENENFPALNLNTPANMDLWKKHCGDHQEEIKKFVMENWQAFDYFFWYVMDSKNITSHGGSIPGWLDDDNFFDALKTYMREENDG
jgi:hypothetical protein